MSPSDQKLHDWANATLIAANTREIHKQIRKAVQMLSEARHALRNAAADADDAHARVVMGAAESELSEAGEKSLNAIELTAGLLKPSGRKAGGR